MVMIKKLRKFSVKEVKVDYKIIAMENLIFLNKMTTIIVKNGLKTKRILERL
jgi:hypothetical protein